MIFNKKMHDWNMKSAEAMVYRNNVRLTSLYHYCGHSHAEPCLDGVIYMLQTEFYNIDNLQRALKQCRYVMTHNKLSDHDLAEFKEIERLIRYAIVRNQSSRSTYTRLKTLSFKKR